MKMQKRLLKLITLSLCLAIIASLALTFAACGKSGDPAADTSDKGTAAVSGAIEDSSATDIGKGEKHFVFTVSNGETEKVYNVRTDKTTVGEALLELGLIDGEEGQYGLFVKTVDGVTADYDADKSYWAFYINGEYASVGVDSAEIENGAKYAMVKEIG